jgi:adenylosuccinate synthase
MRHKDLGNTCVLGLQWGDEGKGKVVDLLVEHFDVVARYAGGANAGHTVVIDSDRFALHQVPSGVLREGVMNIIASGAVIDPAALLGEIESLRQRGVRLDGDNLRISDRAHLVFPWHRREDVIAEGAARAGDKIGTTARGIGPCYADKAGRRWGIRVCELCRPAGLRERILATCAYKNALFRAVYECRETFDANAIAAEYLAFGEQLRPFMCDATALLNGLIRQGKRVLFEGAQGTLLDVDHGTYPFVTSSSTTNFAAGAGVPASAANSILGVAKAYTTRVGRGPFPTEQAGEVGDIIRERGGEYGTTTGRPRRCGWFDAVATAYAARVCGPTHLAIMHLDTLSGMRELRVCVGYRIGKKIVNDFPADVYSLEEAEPVYETLPGWSGEIGDCREFSKLPDEARRYVEFISARLETPVRIISVGPARDQTIILEDN